MLNASPHTAWVLVGPTAAGKSAVAQWLAERHRAAILSADAMLVYRGMDIGTDKPPLRARGDVPYMGLDCVEASLPFSVGDWLDSARTALARLSPPRPLIVAGGTGLYVKAILSGLESGASDPARRRQWDEQFARGGIAALLRELDARGARHLVAPGDLDNPRRLIRAIERAEAGAPAPAGWRGQPPPPAVGLRLPRAALHRRIEERVARMFAGGLVEEAATLRTRQGQLSSTASQAIGYAEALALHDGLIGPGEARERTAARTRQLAKRQDTWFRRQLDVRWIDLSGDEPVAVVAGLVLEAWRKYGPTPIRL
ncbi:MAG: tRNA (adenosine(37)-N6)-dimethylallyltransferase MiaA [Kiritimatiellae bacterium]|nr:tRNA (adenosine(37)-N6)-dimethylallyltransferase MiaA [Kiritimatiellia bacterium]